jgi:AcrR family transcriptional regulator
VRILEVAKEAFTRSGPLASLDDIAREASVGAGTLHRHFPTRDALIEAVYRTAVEKLAAAEKKFSESLPPIEALRAWMLLFVDYIATKQIIASACGVGLRCAQISVRFPPRRFPARM